MTPLPKPTAHIPKVRHPVQFTSSQYLQWQARKNRKPAPFTRITPQEAAAAIAHVQGYPYWRDVVEAVADGTPQDEVDAGFLAAVRMEPRVVGTADGQVPMEVARRLYEAGLIRKQK